MRHMLDEQFEAYIEAVQRECPDIDSETIAAAFLKYQEDYNIPPQDSMRSIIRSMKNGTKYKLESHPTVFMDEVIDEGMNCYYCGEELIFEDEHDISFEDEDFSTRTILFCSNTRCNSVVEALLPKEINNSSTVIRSGILPSVVIGIAIGIVLGIWLLG
jgi:hypothetical protein